MESFRSLIFVFLCAAVLYAYYLKKINHKIFITTLTLLIIIDLWAVDKRYLNNDDFVPGREATVPFQPLEADKVILQDKDIYYRVYDLLADPFRNARTSYFHKSIGGYHGAKLQRYQDIIEHHLVNNNMSVINMLNTKYFILPSRDSEPTAHMNSQALGNAWFVPTFRIVNNANEEIDALAGFNPSYEAIIDKRFEKYVHSLDIHLDTTSYIQLVHYHPNRLRYKSNTANTKLAIFSDVYYEKGWKAYIDGELVPHFRANYILRAMVIPPGSHEIEFRFEPRSYFLGKKISLISSIILLFLMVFLVYTEIRGRKKHPLSD
jgi:hypothetical protein